ncbi:MAG: tetratricopeptide repeat protein [Planctomycetaceae bacterium]
MGQGKSIPRVSSGVPWWLWLVALLATVAVVLGIIADQDHETAADIFERAVQAIDAQDGETLVQCLESLEQLEGTEDQVALLKGIQDGGTDRDPRSVKVLAPFLDHPNTQYKKLALKFSARANQKMGNSDRARELHQEYAAIDPSDVSPHLLLMRLYMDAGAFQSARDAAAAVLKLQPENRDAMGTKAMIQVVTGESQEAKQLYATMLKTEGDRAAASPDTIKNYINALLKTDEADAALKFTQENPELLTDPVTRVELYMQTNQLDEVNEILNGLQLEPDSPLFVQVRGARAMNDGDWELAVGLLTQAALQMPRSVSVFEQLESSATNNSQSELAEACRQNVEALRRLEQQMESAIVAIGDNMNDPELRLKVVDVAEQMGRYNEARQWLNSAATVAPGRQTEILKRRDNLDRPKTPIVSIGAAFTAPAKSQGDAVQESNEEQPAPDEAAPAAAPSEESTGEPESADEGQAKDESTASDNLESVPE